MAGSSSIGATLSVGSTPVEVAEITSINGINMTADVIDVSSFDSPNAFKEKVVGLKDSGEVAFAFNTTTANWSQLRTVFGTTDEWEISFPTATPIVATFNAILSQLGTNAQLEGKQEGSGTLSISGEITWS
jgi:hypothetical protein